MRVQSPKQFRFKGGDVGWLHQINGGQRLIIEQKPKPIPVINVGKLMAEWTEQTKREQIRRLSQQLGVIPFCLNCLQCAWAAPYRAWAFPMRDGYGEYTGIRLRAENGRKWCVPGSHQGIFQSFFQPQRTALICEGPTDTAAALTLGFYAVGKPSCSGGMPHVRTALQRLGVRRAIIVADNDDAGLRGAQMQANQLPIPNASLVLPAKDLREFVKLGGTNQILTSIIDQLVWKQPHEHAQ